METLINSTSIGNIIITAGSVILLLVLIKLFAWEQLTGIFTAREEKIANDIDGAEAAGFQAQIDSDKPENMTLSNWQTDTQLYKENRDVCRADQAAFEDYAYSVQDQLIVEKAAEKDETEE